LHKIWNLVRFKKCAGFGINMAVSTAVSCSPTLHSPELQPHLLPTAASSNVRCSPTHPIPPLTRKTYVATSATLYAVSCNPHLPPHAKIALQLCCPINRHLHFHLLYTAPSCPAFHPYSYHLSTLQPHLLNLTAKPYLLPSKTPHYSKL
jgi:hypothetical protein